MLARGKCIPEGILPQAKEMEMEFTAQEVYLGYVAPTTALADNHAMMLDLITVGQMTLLRLGKYNLNTLFKEDWAEKNKEVKGDPRVAQLVEQIRHSRNVRRRHEQLQGILRLRLRGRRAFPKGVRTTVKVVRKEDPFSCG